MSKKNYVVHYRNLKYYLSQGLILTKVHKILEFERSDWMKPYIDFNTQKRKEATNEADKKLFKLLNNAVYRKTMENVRKPYMKLNKPIYVGCTVSELSKLAMYEFWYDFVKKKM